MKVAMEIIKWLLVVAIIASLISAFATWAGLVDLPNRICTGLLWFNNALLISICLREAID